jgi:hypothetical protein
MMLKGKALQSFETMITTLPKRLGGLQGRSGQVQKILLPLGFNPQTVQPVSSGWARGPVWTGPENLAPTQVQSSDCPACIKWVGSRADLDRSRKSCYNPDSILRLSSTYKVGGLQDRSGQGQKILLPPRFNPQTAQPVSRRYTDYANLAHSQHLRLSVQSVFCLMMDYFI